MGRRRACCDRGAPRGALLTPGLRIPARTLSTPDGPLALPAVDVGAGELVCLVGPSGAGKTQTLSVLASAGASQRPARLAWTPQRVDDAIPAAARVGAWANAGRSGCMGVFWGQGLALPATLRLPDAVLDRRFGSLSTGERQRVLVGLAATGDAGGWVADEPTSAQDAAGTAAVVACLRAFAQRGRPVLVASHDPAVQAAADRLVRVGGGAEVPSLSATAVRTAVQIAERARPPRLVWDGLAVDGRLAACAGAVGAGLTALTGPSGVGKSTLLRVLGGLLAASAGRVVWEGGAWLPASPWPGGGRRAQVVFAEAARTLRSDRTAGALVGQVAAARGEPMPPEAAWRALGLAPSVADLPAGRLSGGMAARVALLRALTARPEVLLLDEPTAALDDETTATVLAALTSTTAPPLVIAATHDPRWVAAADAMLTLAG